jgi:hypothetical protein
MIIQNVKNLIHANETNTSINCDVKFDVFSDYLPFTSTSTDPEEYGRQLYADLQAGKYGPIAPYVPPTPPTK